MLALTERTLKSSTSWRYTFAVGFMNQIYFSTFYHKLHQFLLTDPLGLSLHMNYAYNLCRVYLLILLTKYAFTNSCSWSGLQDAFPGYDEPPHGYLRTDRFSAIPLDGQQVWQETRTAWSQAAHEEASTPPWGPSGLWTWKHLIQI